MNLGRLFRTVRHLQARQVFYRLYYPLKKLWWRPRRKLTPDQLQRAISMRSARPFHHTTPDVWVPHSNGFALLNKRVDFGDRVDWDFQKNGLLWAYHLHYFGWLRNEGVNPEEARSIMRDYVRGAGTLRHAPYPASLRIIHWTAFALRYGMDEEIAVGLFEDALRLAAFPEYQIGANHVLTNGFGLFHAAVLFGDAKLMRAAMRILDKELDAQILDDGGHYERSPGYHAQLLSLVISCTAVAESAPELVTEDLTRLLLYTASSMTDWLRSMMPQKHSEALPVFGDTNKEMAESVGGIARLLSTASLISTAALDDDRDRGSFLLEDSGYRRLDAGPITLVANIGPPAPTHQPGHSHADPLSFVVFCNGAPVITHHGCSTYERGPARDAERATRMHNCITPEEEEQDAAELWAAFRMGRRPRVRLLEDRVPAVVEASHDGFRGAGFIHRRRWEIQGESIVITDVLEGPTKHALSHLHFHPDYPPKLVAPYVVEAGGLRITFQHYEAVHLHACSNSDGYNKIRPAICTVGKVSRLSALILTPITACSSISSPGPGPTS